MSDLTDKQRLLALLKDFGVTPTSPSDDDSIVGLERGVGEVRGYPFFVCNFTFDDTGKFMYVGVWE